MSKDDEGAKISTGRLSRFTRLAGLSARLSGELVARGVRHLSGQDATSLLGGAAAEKVVATLGELKGLAMKAGQALSMEPELLTPEIRGVIARLQNQAPPMAFSTIEAVVRSELGQPLEALFSSFEPTALASASLGQVHRAVTREGAQVAVKVQYPDIAAAVQSDLANVGTMVSVMGATSGMPRTQAYYAEMRQSFLDELDYRLEAEQAEAFAARVGAFPELVVPRVHRALSSSRVLTLDFLDGEPVRALIQRRDQLEPAERFRVARLLLLAIWGPFLASGLVHADPHPGNFLLLPGGKLGVLDFGAVKQMSDTWTRNTRRMVRALLNDEPLDVLALCLQNGFELDEPEEARPFVEHIVRIVTRPLRVAEFDFGTANTARLMREHFLAHALLLKKMRPPTEGLLFFRAVGGLNMNLQNLAASGPFRRVWEECLERTGVE